MDFFKSLESKVKGSFGETVTTGILYYMGIKGYDGYPLHNIYLPKGNGEYTEVDVAYVSAKGIFVFESKNYSGWIFGSETDKNWTACLSRGQKNHFYNPVIQNRVHINTMKKLIGYDIPYFSIIVFSDRCELKKIDVFDPTVRVVQYKDLFDTIADIWSGQSDVFSDEEMKTITNSLKACTKVDSQVKASHIESVKKKAAAQNSYNFDSPKQNIELSTEKPHQSTQKKIPDSLKNVDIMDLISSTFPRR